jgi:hypothetical protein
MNGGINRALKEAATLENGNYIDGRYTDGSYTE